MHWDFLADYLTSKFKGLKLCSLHISCYIYRFVDADGNNYNPARRVTGPYGSTYVFTGPKVH